MKACLTVRAAAMAPAASLPRRHSRRTTAAPPPRGSRRALVVRAHDDDTVLPIFRLPPRDQKPVENLPKPQPLGGKTMGEELELIHKSMSASEAAFKQKERRLYSDAWQGDVYVGSQWNVGSFLALTALAVPLAGLLFAWLTYGSLWGNLTPL